MLDPILFIYLFFYACIIVTAITVSTISEYTMDDFTLPFSHSFKKKKKQGLREQKRIFVQSLNSWSFAAALKLYVEQYYNIMVFGNRRGAEHVRHVARKNNVKLFCSHIMHVYGNILSTVYRYLVVISFILHRGYVRIQDDKRWKLFRTNRTR